MVRRLIPLSLVDHQNLTAADIITGKKKASGQKLSPFVAWTAGRAGKSKSLKSRRKPEANSAFVLVRGLLGQF